MPATGLINNELKFQRCYYTALFPGSLILLNSFLSIVPIAVVVILYSIILVKALKNVRKIKASKHYFKNSKDKALRIYRGNTKNVDTTHSAKNLKTKNGELNRSTSFDSKLNEKAPNTKKSPKSKSIGDLTDDNTNANFENKSSKSLSDSGYSVYTLESSYSDPNSINIDVVQSPRVMKKRNDIKKEHKVKEPNKWRAITIVMLTTGSFIFTWLPFFFFVIFYVFCPDKLSNPTCINMRSNLGGPMTTLAFLNSLFNPIIYAWWHKGFQRSVKMYFQRFCETYFRRNSESSSSNLNT